MKDTGVDNSQRRIISVQVIVGAPFTYRLMRRAHYLAHKLEYSGTYY